MPNPRATKRLTEIVADPASAGWSWRIDPDTPVDEREAAHVTAATVAQYLRDHPINVERRMRAPEVLLLEPAGAMCYVRWPNGSLRWETVVSLAARGFALPVRGLLGLVALLLLVLCPQLAAGQLADPTLTPGVTRALTRHQVCTTRWGLDRRHVTLAMKKTIFARYGIPWSQHAQYEVDHVISRELGGADDVDNLAPEPWFLTVDGQEMGAHQKDRAENATHRAICAGTISLADAQQQIATDWTVLYLRFVGPFPAPR